MRVFHRDEQEARREDAVVPPLEPQPFVTEEGREIERLRAELAALKSDANLVSLNAVNAALLAEVAALKEKP
jgi:hypothetical protein